MVQAFYHTQSWRILFSGTCYGTAVRGSSYRSCQWAVGIPTGAFHVPSHVASGAVAGAAIRTRGGPGRPQPGR
jgi:hypothetical protein